LAARFLVDAEVGCATLKETPELLAVPRIADPDATIVAIGLGCLREHGLPSYELDVVVARHVKNGAANALHAGLSSARIQPAATIKTGFRAATGGPPPPPDATNAASISGQSMPSALARNRA
jgi:hypothetical protein